MTKITATSIKKALQKITDNQCIMNDFFIFISINNTKDKIFIIVSKRNNFIALYCDSLTQSFYGLFSDNHVMIFNATTLKEIYERELKEIFPDKIICIVS